MGERYLKRKFADCYIRKHGLNQKIYSVPQLEDVIVVNEYPMRLKDPYIKCDEGNELLNAISARFIGKVVAVTEYFLLIDVRVARGYRQRALRVEDFRLAFYRYAVVEDNCLLREWSYGELDLNGECVLDNIIGAQELLEIKKIK